MVLADTRFPFVLHGRKRFTRRKREWSGFRRGCFRSNDVIAAGAKIPGAVERVNRSRADYEVGALSVRANSLNIKFVSTLTAPTCSGASGGTEDGIDHATVCSGWTPAAFAVRAGTERGESWRESGIAKH